MTKINLRSCTRFLRKYGDLSLYDEYLKNIYTTDHEYINFVTNDSYVLIGNSDEPYGTSTDHEYFFINYDLFDIISPRNQNVGI